MENLYTTEQATLYHGDCLEVLSALPHESVDLIFADPPYNLSNGGISVQSGKQVTVDKGNWDSSQGVQKDFEFHRKWIAACKKILKPNGSLWVSGTYHSIYECGYALWLDGWYVLNEIIWYKPNAPPHIARRRFAAAHETLIWARKAQAAQHKFHYDKMKLEANESDFMKTVNRQMRSVWGYDEPVDMWAINTPGPREKAFGKHPTQKPLKLIERIVLACTDQGDVVLDPFCGSGTTGVAALSQGRRFIGVEQDREFLTKLTIPRLDDILF